MWQLACRPSPAGPCRTEGTCLTTLAPVPPPGDGHPTACHSGRDPHGHSRPPHGSSARAHWTVLRSHATRSPAVLTPGDLRAGLRLACLCPLALPAPRSRARRMSQHENPTAKLPWSLRTAEATAVCNFRSERLTAAKARHRPAHSHAPCTVVGTLVGLLQAVIGNVLRGQPLILTTQHGKHRVV